MNRKQYFILLRIICSALLFAVGIIFSFSPILSDFSLYMYIAAAFVVGFDVVIDAFNGIFHGHILDENFLMTIGSISAFILGECAEGTVILLLYQVGELFQAIAVGKSRNSISDLMNICPDYARTENGEVIDPFEVSVGDIILVEPGEKVALDGVIVSGSSSVDTSALTGEPIPRFLNAGDEIISGFVNLSSPLRIKVTKEFDQSTVSKILDLVENASSRKASIESFVTRFAKYYTPIVVLAALLVALLPPLIFKANFNVWLLRAVMFIVISCPCALVVSVPLSFFGALGGASRIGVLVKGSNYLEAMADIDTVIFDKTGTLTEGKFGITAIRPSDTVSQDELLYVAALCEYHSSHPIATCIKQTYARTAVPTEDMIYENIAGKGISIKKGNRILLAGSAELMHDFGISPDSFSSDSTTVHIADGKYLGYITLDDKIKDSTPAAINALKNAGIRTVMLSGDSVGAVSKVSEALAIDQYFSELLPDDKVRIAEELISSAKGKVAFVGDGVNDAPVLARSDIGIAMGALGSDAAIEAADIVIMNDDLSLISKTIEISKKAVRISKQNIAFSLAVKFSQLLLSLIGLGSIWMAVFADVGVLILAIINSMRTLTKK